MGIRLTRDRRLHNIMKESCVACKNISYTCITRDQVAEATGCAPALINHYFETMDKFRENLLQYAIDNHCYHIIAQAMVVADPAIKGLDPKLAATAFKQLGVR